MTWKCLLACGMFVQALGAQTGADTAWATLTRLAKEARGEHIAERIQAAIEALHDPRFKVREQAVRDIRTLGHAAIPSLKRALQADDPETRMRAARLLTDIEKIPPTLPPKLRPALRDLHQAPDRILPLLPDLIRHPNPSIQHAAVHELRRQTGTNHAFHIHLPPAQKEAATKRWTHWLATHQAEPAPDPALLITQFESGHLSAHRIDDGSKLWERTLKPRTTFALVTPQHELVLGSLQDQGLHGYNAQFEDTWTWTIPFKDQADKAQDGGVYGMQALPDGTLLLGLGYHADAAVIELSPKRTVVDTTPPPAWQNPCVITLPLQLPGGERILPFEHGNRLVAFDRYGAVRWSRDLQSPRRVRQLPSGNLLVSTIDAVLELSPDGDTLWKHECREAIDAIRLPDGRTAALLAFFGVLLIEVDHSQRLLLDKDLRYGSLSLIPPGPFTRPAAAAPGSGR